MSNFVRKTVTAMAIAMALSGVAVAAEQAPPAHPAMSAPGTAMNGPKAADTSAIDAKFKGDKKAEYSYMVGMDVARGISTIKDDIDLNIMVQALQTAVKGGPTTMTEAEAMTVRQEFVQKIQAKQMAKAKEEAEKNQKEGEDFLAKNKTKKGVKTTASGLQYEVVKEGTGAKPKATDKVKVEYTGTKIDGTKFDATADHNPPGPATFPLNGVIPGWTEGMQLMPVGSEYKLFVPANLAYKDRGPPAIGPNATLIFDVKLLAIEPPDQAKPMAPAAPGAKPTIVPPKPAAH
ncbi:MAG TPA: FKBP-type peptidyl-prolyl cis-trans isomerase [Rudaea sp.]|jgi:FKBP-type peptidyl-prolyl cis-trans isomerase|nr:FKBP-type peptidyl-prolyl cis-trans isomerase [Rudaea sp.]